MNLIDLARDGGLAVQLLLVPAIVGTAALGLIRLVARTARSGVFEGSLSIVLGAATASVGLGLRRALDVLAAQGASGAFVVGLLRLVGGTFLLALIGAAVLGALELASTLRRRRSPAIAPVRWLRPTVLTGWVVVAIALGAELTGLLRIASSIDPSTLAPLATGNPAREFEVLSVLTRVGVAGGTVALVLGLATLWLAFDRFRSPVNAIDLTPDRDGRQALRSGGSR